jgi:hypothetical protein
VTRINNVQHVVLHQLLLSGAHLDTTTYQPVFRIRIRIDFGPLDPDPGGQKLPTKIEKS